MKEEIQLLQRAKEFLDEEREIILSAEVEANEYLLSRLSETIDSIREDFNQLNTSQLNDIENEYKQLLQTVEENLLSNQTIDGKPTSNESKNQHLEEDYENVLQELTILNSDNKKLSQTVFSMVSLYLFLLFTFYFFLGIGITFITSRTYAKFSIKR